LQFVRFSPSHADVSPPCSLTASAVFAYSLGFFLQNRFIQLENQPFITAVTVSCATVLLFFLWNSRRAGPSSSPQPSQTKLHDELCSSVGAASSNCCGGVCRDGGRSEGGACCQDNSDSVSIASSVGSHKGMSKDAFHKWKRENPDELSAFLLPLFVYFVFDDLSI
jgi:hypothetical protein